MSLKIVCISDTHNFHPEIEVPDGDVLIHAGDATIQGSVPEVADFAEWFNALPHKHKIFVAGNHDWLYQRMPALGDTFVPSLHDKLIEIEGLKIYGSSWNPWFQDWAFNLHRGPEIAAKWERIPDDVDILVTHTPPYGVRDQARGLCLGCRDLLPVVKRIKPKLHVFGHIHEGYGQIEMYGTHFINAAICDAAYYTTNKPIVVEI